MVLFLRKLQSYLSLLLLQLELKWYWDFSRGGQLVVAHVVGVGIALAKHSRCCFQRWRSVAAEKQRDVSHHYCHHDAQRALASTHFYVPHRHHLRVVRVTKGFLFLAGGKFCPAQLFLVSSNASVGCEHWLI